MNSRKKPRLVKATTSDILKDINKTLQAQDGCKSYRLELSPYKDRDSDAAVYDETSDAYDIILCLYHGNKCVSSVTGRYNKSEKSMEILSKTHKDYEGLKYNSYLRTAFIYLMYFIKPTIKRVFSYATNPISTYSMYKYYHATNPDLQEYVKTHNLTRETFTLSDSNDFHKYFIEKNTQTIESAEDELYNMLEECSEEAGMECGVEDLGFDTKEAALKFIMTTMNQNTVALELNIEKEDITGELLNKLANTQIICRTFGGRKNKSIRRRNTSIGRRTRNK